MNRRRVRTWPRGRLMLMGAPRDASDTRVTKAVSEPMRRAPAASPAEASWRTQNMTWPRFTAGPRRCADVAELREPGQFRPI